MSDLALLTELFERHRTRLASVAYRMLGSVSEAEDAVQEAWLRLRRTAETDASDAIENLAGWLTTVVGRVCVDMLRARHARREDYFGTWLPEPVVSLDTDADTDPEQRALLADSVGLALLVVLETLTPSERLAFVLHDMFGLPFDDIAVIVGREPAATRQLASRARRRVRGAAPQPDADLAKQREVVTAFLAASRAGDFDALLELLDPDVVFRRDRSLTQARVTGRVEVARMAIASRTRFLPYCRPAIVNGAAGIVVVTADKPVGVCGFTISNGRIATIDLVTDKEKLRGVNLGTDDDRTTAGVDAEASPE